MPTTTPTTTGANPDAPAARHPSSATEVFVWEAPALGVVPGADELTGVDVILAAGAAPNDIVAGATAELSRLIGREPRVFETNDHEIYLNDPIAFADMVNGNR